MSETNAGPSPSRREAWLRGPVDGVPPLLQPVAHALIQAREDAASLLDGFPADRLWGRPADMASVGFHLRHMRGVIDRLFTYARGELLTVEQRRELAGEGTPPEEAVTAADLLRALDEQVDAALAQLRATDPATLTEPRGVGQAQLPSTVLGLLFHAAEHVQRHAGQLLVTARVQRGQGEPLQP
jgi:uncharacterized damage-inducible protein DinB